MISKLIGLLDTIGDDTALIDCNGVGYLVQCSQRTLAALPAEGEKMAIMVETVVRQDMIRLYGFSDQAEKTWFNTLVGLQGVGAKVALAILSALSTDELASAVALRDTKSIGRAHGVGPRLASRIIADLDGKAPKGMGSETLDFQKSVGNGSVKTSAAEAISALTNLGYPRAKVSAALGKIVSAQGDDLPTEKLIRLGLKELAS
ncbi:MAG: Holliday junction branch migration protein RuvA [Candidatus Devosia phytovorans]|uniref:Holliday junction branch migration complex subunit RuvA n=1 Tax=Candidatus Devosia phytovorans TaxID=3121372 RepID=A0AAJ5VVN1_9HYPH|nr:Holliday junction branch migration protein RuvA [Devosia sp.]WEK04725.1 MAG: Holliday junction branch migration protein RuvA [Devosia sp.]